MRCPSCGSENPAHARFCQNCGTALEMPRPTEGERKFLSILFADVVGSTAMGEELDPEQIAEIMNGAFGFLNAAVTRYGGTVGRLLGDAILAFFGAPVAHEDDAERAVHAALAMQQGARQYAQTVEREYGVQFRMRVGINTGLAVLTRMGDEAKTEYTAMGDTANVASRMQSAADPGTILISGETYHLVRPIFDVMPRGAIEVKGKSAPVEAYEVVGVKATRGRTRGLEGMASPLVGRDAEAELLRQSVETLQTSRGWCVAVIGEAGLGKSRLVAEIRTREAARDPRVTWLEGRAISYGQTVAYYPWRQIIRQAIGAHEADPAQDLREKLRGHGDAGDVDAVFLESLLAAESEETLAAVADMAGDELVRGINQAIRDFITALAGRQPVVFVFDDMHWADEASLALLVTVADLVQALPVLLIVVLRPDKAAESWTTVTRLRDALGDRFRQIELEPLSPSHAGELLSNLLFVEDLPESVRAVILRKSEGNPFFLEEVIRSLIDSGHIVQEDGHWRATEAIVDVAIPDTLAGVLSARIDRLPQETKRVAQTAAVIGRIFPYPLLDATVADAPPSERIENAQEHLATLTYEELVRERARDPELEYIFKHALTQEAAYDSLLLRRRKEYHRRVALALQDLYPQRLDDLRPCSLTISGWARTGSELLNLPDVLVTER